MATKKTTPAPVTPQPGVGLDLTAGKYGLEQCPGVVIATHPIHGTTVFGPFVTVKAAELWAATEADDALAIEMGSARGCTIHATYLNVPLIYSPRD